MFENHVFSSNKSTVFIHVRSVYLISNVFKRLFKVELKVISNPSFGSMEANFDKHHSDAQKELKKAEVRPKSFFDPRS